MTQSSEKTSGDSVYVHLLRLARMEGDLMVIAAEQRLNGQVDDLHLHQLLNIAWSFAQEGYTDPQGFCASVAGLAHAVEQLALETDADEWSCWIKAYQEDEEERRLAGEEDELRRVHVSHYSENGSEYKSLPYRGDSMDGIVYLPVIVPETGHFEVGCRGDECVIAIVPQWTAAVAIAAMRCRTTAVTAVSLSAAQTKASPTPTLRRGFWTEPETARLSQE